MAKYTLYKLKTQLGSSNLERALKEDFRLELQQGQSGVIVRDSDSFCDGAKLYIIRSMSPRPAWLPPLLTIFEELPSDLPVNNYGSLVIFNAQEETFIISYGHAYHSIDQNLLEPNFGLKVMLNSADPSALRSAETTDLGNSLKNIVQSPISKDVREYGIDEASTLVNKITGKLSSDKFAKSASGRKSLTFTEKCTLQDIVTKIPEILEHFRSTAYTSTVFAFIDRMSEENDPVKLESLNNQLLTELKDIQSDRFELLFPELLVDGAFYTTLSVSRGQKIHDDDLYLRDYQNFLRQLNLLDSLDLEALKKHKFTATLIDTGTNAQESVYNSLTGSINLMGSRYVLNEGSWYDIDQAYLQSIEDCFQRSAIQAPVEVNFVWEKTCVAGATSTASSAGYKAEDWFNRKFAETYPNFICMDRNLISFDGVPFSAMEVADLIDLEEKKFVHVKRGRKSSVLSHFFKQGRNSCGNMNTFQFRRNVFEYIQGARPEYVDLANRVLLEEYNASEWTVEYWLADSRRPDGSFKIPFFSRISMKDEFSQIERFGYTAVMRFIELEVVDEDQEELIEEF